MGSIEASTPEAVRRDEIFRNAAIEVATKEELEGALEKVSGLLENDQSNRALQKIVRQLEEEISEESPETIH